MRRTLFAGAVFAVLLPAALAGCGGSEDERLDPAPFIGAWFPCQDENCAAIGGKGLALAPDRWFHQIVVTPGAVPDDPGLITIRDKECCWHTEADHIVIDLRDRWQELWIRFLAEDRLQIEVAWTTGFNSDPQVQDMETTECHEGEQFPEPDTDEDDEDSWDPDAWTAEKCWTEYWEPLGLALRVIAPDDLAGILAAMYEESGR